jgi:glycosyltransferase involved in cell wall biosynthesis
MWVAGERQRRVAINFGYTSATCWGGLYACDWQAFAHNAHKDLSQRKRAFLYAGRYAAEKGIQTLALAYHEYLQIADNPWKLICVGTGSYTPEKWYNESIEHRGFVQPEDLPALMSDCAAFILPSTYEPWGLVVQEAAASGLPLICTDSCGARVHLLQDNYNGFVVDAGAVDQLVAAMLRMSAVSDEEWKVMSRRSFELSQMFTPERWADTLVKYTRRHPRFLATHKGLPEVHEI